MIYEIPREEFKKTLDRKKYYYHVDIGPAQKESKSVLTETLQIPFNSQFGTSVDQSLTNKSMAVVLFTLGSNAADLREAAKMLEQKGHNTIYFYQGNLEDILLEKGIN